MQTRRDFLAISAGALAAMGARWPQDDDGYVVHEWGVITFANGCRTGSVRTAGEEKAGVPLDLPAFVHKYEAAVNGEIREWESRPIDKPIVYFYSKSKRTIAFKVAIPTGRPRAWWPPADEYGPRPKLNWSGKQLARREPNPKPEDIPPVNGKLEWKRLVLDPDEKAFPAADGWWPKARETDSTPVVHAKGTDKFLFYDAFAVHDPALRIRWKEGGTVDVTSGAPLPYRHLIALQVRGGEVRSAHHAALAKGESVTMTVAPGKPESLVANLMDAGLYEKEARGLVDIWTKEFFEIDGHRVLAILPRETYDQLLPAEIVPAPKEFNRVLVAHVECLGIEQQREILEWIRQLAGENIDERAQAENKLRARGPFAEEMIREALDGAGDPEVAGRLKSLLPK